MPDHLAVWCRTRRQVPWNEVDDPGQDAVAGARDGVSHLIRTDERDPDRARRLLTDLDAMRADLSDGRALDFAAMRRWQDHVLGTGEPDFRTGPAFAKGGRERYGLDGHTRRRFEECLREAGDAGVPLPSRAARAYLDVCFFHPFDDGNARAALLVLTFVLGRAGVVLDQVGPVRRLSRSADAAGGTLEPAGLVAVLIRATRDRRLSPG